ncbi:MAG TPA: AAA family ATPase [Rhizomicrobium sp.]
MTRRPTKAPQSGRRRNAGQVRAASPVLYGREDDIALVERLIDAVRQSGAALTISGEPGIGKSALLDVAQDLARARAMRVLRLSGAMSESHLPFSALHQAVGPILKQAGTLPPRQRSALQAGFGLSDDAAAPDLFLVGLATLTLLTESAARKPILILADDVQWLDQPSRDVLAFISRRLSSDPIVLLMAIRHGSEEFLPHSEVPRRQLFRLPAAAAERLLDARTPDLPSDLRRRFLDEAAGNPLALVELPRGERRPEVAESHWLPLTDRLERAFFSRAAGLPAVARALLLVAAENDSKSLREVLDAGEVLLGERVGLDALAPAVSAMLIEVAAGEVHFRHPLIRSAVHQAASAAMHHDVHAALARVIKDHSDRPIWHRMASAIGPDDALAGELDDAAARAQRRGALAAAIAALENAARLSGTAASKSERLLRAAALAVDLGQPEAVERLLREADVQEPEGHMRARLAWIREIGQPLALADPFRASTLARFAADARAHGDDDLAVGLLWRAAQYCWWSNASDTVCAGILAAANELAVPADDARRIAIAGYVGPLEHGHEVYGLLAARVATAGEDPAVAWVLGTVANAIGAYEFAVGLLTAASTAFREQGRLGYLGRVLFGRSCAETETGDWMSALKNCAEAARLAEETTQAVWAAAATVVQTMLEARRGQFDAAEARANQVEPLLLSPGTSFWRAMLQQARGIIALGEGRPVEAYEHMLRIWTPGDPSFNKGLQFYCLADYVEAAVSCDQTGAAAAAVEEIEHRAGSPAVPWVRMILSYCKALLAPPDRAEKFFQDSLGPEVQTWPFRRGCCLLAYGAWLRRQRRIMDARTPLRTARDIFDALGAAPMSDRARRELRAAGEASRPAATRALDALTPQELQIAELAAGGLSNKEIGARLYLSHRTVGYHLYRIFPKLGITVRSGLQTALNRLLQSAG